MRIFSGIQPTGAKHLGNYAGGFRQYAETQEQGEAFFCIVDLHSVSVEHDPQELRERTLDVFAMLIATGLDPDRSTIFAQSHVHGARGGELAAVVGHELRRAPPHDAVQGEVRVPEVRLGRAVHVSRAPGRRHPALPDRHRPGRGRPAPAHRAHARRRRAFQLPLRRHVHAPARRLSRDRRQDHGPPGAATRRCRPPAGPRTARCTSSTRPTRSGASSRSPSPTRAARSSTPRTRPASRT